MSPLATILSTWCAIYAFAALYYIALWSRTRSRDPEHLTYGCICFAFAIDTAGSALLASATSIDEGAFALRLHYLGGFALVAFAIDFISHLAFRPAPRIVLVSYAICAFGIALVLSGRLVDPNDVALGPTLLHHGPFFEIEPRTRIEGAIGITLGAALALAGCFTLIRRSRHDRDVRIIAIGASISAVAGAHDTLLRFTGIGWTYLLEHTGLITLVAVSYVLLRRLLDAARELERRRTEIKSSVAELRRTQEELVRKEQLAAVGELSAVIAHEVRNPLAILKNAVSSLRRPTLTSGDRNVLFGILEEETDRLNRLVRDLLAYARPVEPKEKPVDLEPLIVRAFEAARGSRGNVATPYTLDLELHGPSAALGDPELLRHAFVNVIDNALQAMHGGGRLLVRSIETKIESRKAAALSFSDNGEGMDTLVRAKALDPFFTTRPSGTGLGLAIVERVVKNHGGALSIDSTPGGGTTVTMTLPCDDGAAS